HLLKNLGDTLETLLYRHHRQLREAARQLAKTEDSVPLSEEAAVKSPPIDERLKAQRMERRETRFDQVRALEAQGFTVSAIARQTSLSRKTVRKYLNAETCPGY